MLLLAWTAVTVGLAWRVFHARERWTDVCLAPTNDLVERMVGHRTRLAQTTELPSAGLTGLRFRCTVRP